MKSWGLTLRVNPLFLLICLVFFLSGMIWDLLIAFTLVIIHELAHVLAAYFLGYKMNKIELFPFGGMAEYSGLLEMEAKDEIKVALAGPLLNLGLFFIFYILLNFDIIEINSIIKLIINYNLIIATVNLIPALPLDGGRVLRSILVQIYGIKKGNKLAVKFAKIIAVVGILIAVLVLIFEKSNIWFLFFFFFIYALVTKEEKQLFYYFLRYISQRNSGTDEISIRKMAPQVVSDTLTIKEAVSCINPVKYTLFFVLDVEKKIIGVISESTLINQYFKQKHKEMIMRDII
ncbi:MAG: M50 family metallopeptidase [Bacillota bacterium]